MIDNLAKQLSNTKRSIIRDATMLGGRRMVLPASLLACATVLGLFVQAGSHSAQAYYRDGVSDAAWTVVDFGPTPAAVYWDEPAYPQPLRQTIREEIAGLTSQRAAAAQEQGCADLVVSALGAGDKLEQGESGSAAQGLPAAAVAALGLDVPKRAPRQPDLQDELHCLALNIYFEARSEPSKGQRAVAHVVMNRVADRRFPDTVCKVVRQGGERIRHRCQFSWWCDGRSDRPRNLGIWERARAMAQDVYWGRSQDPTEGALWYHADYVMPSWGRVFERGPKIGRHIFYHGRNERVQVAASQKAE
jgi:hypothetical protein